MLTLPMLNVTAGHMPVTAPSGPLADVGIAGAATAVDSDGFAGTTIVLPGSTSGPRRKRRGA